MPDQAALAQFTTGPFFRPRRLGHVNLYVSDLDRTMTFYVNVIGIAEAYRTPLRGGGFVSNGNTHHDLGFVDVNGSLGKARSARAGVLNHLGFELESEAALVTSYRAATAAGQTFSRTADHDVVHSVYGDDPDGNKFELYADITRNWRGQRSGIVTKPKPDWAPGSIPPVVEPCYHLDPPIERVAGAVFHPQRTTHATLVVRDLTTAVLHYTRIVGLQLVTQDGANGFAVLRGTYGPPCLTLFAAGNDCEPCIHHSGLMVANAGELDRSAKQAKQAGVELVADVSCNGRRAVHLRDPDGFLIQLYSDTSPGFSTIGLERKLALYVL